MFILIILNKFPLSCVYQCDSGGEGDGEDCDDFASSLPEEIEEDLHQADSVFGIAGRVPSVEELIAVSTRQHALDEHMHHPLYFLGDIFLELLPSAGVRTTAAISGGGGASSSSVFPVQAYARYYPGG